MKIVDDFLNNITMYRLILYFLILLAGVGLLYSLTGVLPFDPINYIFSFTFLLTVSGIANYVFGKTYESHTNVESWIISAMILGLIIAPPKSFHEVIFLGFAALLMVASKFILAIGRKHIFNPVAVSVAITAIFIGGTANWWVGVSSMLPIVAIGGFLIVRKIKRWDMVLAFLVTALLVIGPSRWARSVSDTPLIFFAAVMLTEPLTTPPTRLLRIIYGVIIGLLFAPQIHFGSIYTTPEIALIIGNIFSYIVSPKYKLVLRLKEKIQLSPDITDYVFSSDKKMTFKPGQYMEWTLSHPKPDDRGNRRYLTLASSPTESEIRVGVKIGNPPSSYKKSLSSLNVGDTIVASQLTGDFTLPKNWNKKLVFTPNKKGERLVFIAGGIGVTPFRSMIKYLIDKNEKRNIVVLYSVKDERDFVYKDIFGEAERKLGIKTHYSVGRFTPEYLTGEVGDYRDRTYYLSGPKALVDGFKSTLKGLGVGKSQIKTDYFPGFA